MIHVANIIEEGRLGGPQVRIANVAHALTGKVETTVILPKENSEKFVEKLEKLQIPFKAFKLTRITKEFKVALRYIFLSLYEVFELVKFFRRENFDLIHVSGGSWQYKGVIAGRLACKKVVWHLNDTSMPWIFRWLFAVISHYVDGYIFASERSKQYYGSLVKKGKPNFVIPAPVDVSLFDPAQNYNGDEDLISRWNGKIVIGSVANINPIKGFDVLIRTAAIVNENFDDIVFVVVGPVYDNQRRYFKKLKQLCEELSARNIEFIGGRDDVRPVLQRFDIYVCSSQSESSPISAWEAMAMEKPIVSTDVGDASRYIKSGENGFIVPVNDIGRIAKAIHLLSEDPKLRKNFGIKSREVAVREFDLSVIAKKLNRCYKILIDST